MLVTKNKKGENTMKRFFILVIMVFSLVGVMTANIYADMDAPMVKPYKAIIVNLDGVELTDYKGDVKQKLDYGTEVTINYEYMIDGQLYGNVLIGEDDVGRVKLSDIKLFDENAKIDVDYNNPFNLRILAKDVVKIHKGPAEAYPILGNIPYNVDIVGYKMSETESPWYCVEYNGNKGWICSLDGAIGVVKEETSIYLTSEETKIYKNSDMQEVVIVIPANTKVNSNIDIDPWSWKEYVEYNGVWGFVDREQIAFEGYEKWKVPYNGVKLFKTAYIYDNEYDETAKKCEVLIENIPVGTELIVEYEYHRRYDNGWIYTSYNGKKGWVYISDIAPVEETLATNATIDEKEIKALGNSVDKDREENEKNLDEGTSIVKEEKKELNLTGNQIIILCIGVAVIIALTAIVTIVLVNKKNKVHETNNKE